MVVLTSCHSSLLTSNSERGGEQCWERRGPSTDQFWTTDDELLVWYPARHIRLSNALTIPTNTLRAVVGLLRRRRRLLRGRLHSWHQRAGVWYTYPPGSGNPTGAFKEIRVLVDGKVVGVVWPFATIYTGGLNHALWSPVVAIGAFLLPPMAVDNTPFLFYFNDGNPHTFTLDIGSTIGYYWLIDANVRCFTDPTLPKGQALTSELRTAHLLGDWDSAQPSTNVTLSTTVTAQYSFSNNQTYDPTGIAETWNQLTSFSTDVKTVTSDGATYYQNQSSYSYPMSGTYAFLAKAGSVSERWTS
ncbi:putative Peptide-N4-(N-acetyl-beta-glucosaminyl) asparagine amidase A [Klebsormidium nitens]|uniref:Putative Peptide-N4-(N-acetyl-beta-glucosaminyl) asparagine amidase A n=1 Tax=Klebsormidium nitens TaxID=105231 RepID=A0A1Y1HVV6_KLENI|nr:putative Peptide-N4-(N-acetyl-beta-glucosaminyl) asparagine amidase A [Klebsormidium nitens]|eukprot:GAQ81329.1 putative Peptide-N4-(N-acetyl-beta-glucosaminyl) asparagine amidase A [Klebsormidium nitens]